MNTYPILNNDPDLIKIKMKDDEKKDLKHRTEKQDYGNIIKSLKIDSEYYKTKYKSLNKKNLFMIDSEILIGTVRLGVGSGLTLSGLARVGIMFASSVSYNIVYQLSSQTSFFQN